MLKRITKAPLIALLLAAMPAHAEIYIVNKPTLDTVPAAGTLQVPQFSLSNIDAEKIRLLQSYGYADRVAAAKDRQQKLSLIAARLAGLKQGGGQEGEIRAALQDMEQETQQAAAFLANFELPEFKQLYLLEEQNAKTIRDLSQKLAKEASKQAAKPLPKPALRPEAQEPEAPGVPASSAH